MAIKDIHGTLQATSANDVQSASLGMSLEQAIKNRQLPIPIETEEQIKSLHAAIQKILDEDGRIEDLSVEYVTDDTGVPSVSADFTNGKLSFTFKNLHGKDGSNGKSAYDIAVKNGFVGTEEQWLASLRGEDGQDGRDCILDNIVQTIDPSDTTSAPSCKAVAEYVETHSGGDTIVEGNNVTIETLPNGSKRINAQLASGTAQAASEVSTSRGNTVEAELTELYNDTTIELLSTKNNDTKVSQEILKANTPYIVYVDCGRATFSCREVANNDNIVPFNVCGCQSWSWNTNKTQKTLNFITIYSGGLYKTKEPLIITPSADCVARSWIAAKGTTLFIKRLKTRDEKIKMYLPQIQDIINKCSGTSDDKLLQFMIVTDVHGDYNNALQCTMLANEIKSIDAVLHAGDYINANSYQEDYMLTYDEQVLRCSQKPFFLCAGNHDVGFNNDNNVVAFAENAELYKTLVQPMLDRGILNNGEYQQDKAYYYHDFAAQKIRLISLNTYEAPTEANNGKTYISHASIIVGEEQANWLANTLYDTPNDYAVVILRHSFGHRVIVENNDFSSASAISEGEFTPSSAYTTLNIDIVSELVNSWKNGQPLSCDVSIADNDNNDGSHFNNGSGYWYHIEKDFSQRGKGNFMCFICGHYHRDIVAKDDNGLVYIASTYTHAARFRPSEKADIQTSEEFGKNFSVTIVTLNPTNKKVYLNKIGLMLTNDNRLRNNVTISTL